MLSKSYVSAGFLILVFSILLSACGPQREVSQNEEEQSEPEKPEELTLWAWEDTKTAFQEVGDKYTEETGIKVNVVAAENADISLDAPAGRGPDLFYETHDRIGDAYLQGLAAEIEITDEQLKGYQQSAIEAFTVEGKLLGIPSSVETIGLFYNKELVPEAPQTIEEINEIAEELTNTDEDEFGFLNITSDFYPTFPFLTAAGGYVFEKSEQGGYDTSDIGLSSDEVVEGAEMIQSWHENGYIPESLTYDVMNGLFREGKVGAIISGPWGIPDFEEGLGDKLAIAPLPTYKGKQLESFLGVKGLAVSEYSENKYWSTDFALFMTNTANSELLFENTKRLPAREDVSIESELYQGIQDQLQYADPTPNIPEMAQVWEPMGDALVFIGEGEDPQEVLKEAEATIKEQNSLLGGDN
ncbi:maltose ABC transporter substrate-binding protein [Halobacillus andaensis]|uniref:Maltodextrin-binding protein n=1 Tax=Halobacillus andaensis TaxID=1176239 RepID=A0A917B6U6_HALAA|nr:extracellular solute-binding protein [Halobacillus andaensis]MBP2006543.1 arabinogalactan oligomer/maltooligosaccharide transport system substrate-binding protein [Halobacillus andaensis]GGF28194.1 maltose ABC transporter substrate-binding protein [Halobacillus andaensis]